MKTTLNKTSNRQAARLPLFGRIIPLLLGFALMYHPAAAQTWNSGGGNNNWSTAANWSPSGAPANAGTANIVFGSGARLTPNVDVAWNINALTFNAAAPAFAVSGSSLTIQAGGIANNSANTQTVNDAIVLGVPQTWSAVTNQLVFNGPVNNNGFLLTVSGTSNTTIVGVISGGGGLTKNGSGTLTLSDAAINTFSGPTQINDGTLVLNSSPSYPLGGTSSLTIGDGTGSAASAIVKWNFTSELSPTGTTPVSIKSDGLMNLNGFHQTVSSLTFTGGSVTNSGGGVLTLLGNVTGNAAATTATISGGSLNLNGNNCFFDIASGAPGADLDISANISNGAIIKTGAGILKLDGTNSIQYVHLEGGSVLLASGSLTYTFGHIGRILPASTFIQTGGVSSVGTLDIGVFQNSAGTYTQSGGTNSVSGTLDIASDLYSTGTYNLQGGALTAAYIALSNTGGTFNQTGGTLNATTFFQNGGTVTGTLQNQGAFIYYSGPFSGRLLNQGTVNFNADFTAGNGMRNDSVVTIASGTSVRTVTLNGAGLDNEGLLTVVAGAVLNVNGPLTNNGQMTLNENLTLGSASTNGGTLNLASGYLLALSGTTPFTNTGAVNLNGAAIAGGGTFTNSFGGVMGGFGTIASNFANSGGLVLVSSNITITHAFSNSGSIQLGSAAASLTGGAINNTGSIQGVGNLSNAITNAATGTIEAIGGTLTIGTLAGGTNSGLVAASAGNKVLFTQGVAVSNGIINLTGGTFDNNSHPLNNTGQISGYGTFRTSGLTNSGTATFTGGLTTVNGNVTNNGKITVAYNPALFTGAVVNSGTFKTTNTTVTYAGTFTNSGVYISDPSTQNFTDLIIGSGGSIVGGTGDLFNVIGNVTNNSTQSATFDVSQAKFRLQGSGTHQFTWSGGEDFSIGTVEVQSGGTAIVANSGATSDSGIYFGALQIDGSARVELQAHTGGPANITVLVISSLNFAGSGLLDLPSKASMPGDEDTVADYGSSNLGDGSLLSGGSEEGSGLSSPAPVPEPGTIGLMVIGALAMAGWSRCLNRHS